jgi:predicted dehydrogenase
MDDFASCILNKRKSVVSGEEAIKDIRVIEAIFRSLETGGSVKLS